MMCDVTSPESTPSQSTPSQSTPNQKALKAQSISKPRRNTPARTVVAAWILVIAVIDQLTKYVAIQTLSDGQTRPFIGTLVQWRLSYNPGAAFSMGENSTWLFTTLQIAAIIGCLWYAGRVRGGLQLLGLGLIAGGAAGNLIDRLTREPGFYHGHVVDFIWLQNFAIFNVADMAITFGVIAIVLGDFLGIKNSSADAANPTQNIAPNQNPAAKEADRG